MRSGSLSRRLSAGAVGRAAIDRVKEKVGRFVMLGTPNFGSFAPVQCIRGIYDMVQKLAFLDASHSPKDIAAEVLNSFPGLPDATITEKVHRHQSLRSRSVAEG